MPVMTLNRIDDYAVASRWEGTALVLRVYAQPGAKTTAFAGMHGDRIKVRLAAPPADGRANECLRDFLAEQFGVPKSRVELVRGATGRAKDVRVAEPTRLPPGFSAERSRK